MVQCTRTSRQLLKVCKNDQNYLRLYLPYFNTDLKIFGHKKLFQRLKRVRICATTRTILLYFPLVLLFTLHKFLSDFTCVYFTVVRNYIYIELCAYVVFIHYVYLSVSACTQSRTNCRRERKTVNTLWRMYVFGPNSTGRIYKYEYDFFFFLFILVTPCRLRTKCLYARSGFSRPLFFSLDLSISVLFTDWFITLQFACAENRYRPPKFPLNSRWRISRVSRFGVGPSSQKPLYLIFYEFILFFQTRSCYIYKYRKIVSLNSGLYKRSPIVPARCIRYRYLNRYSSLFKRDNIIRVGTMTVKINN